MTIFSFIFINIWVIFSVLMMFILLILVVNKNKLRTENNFIANENIKLTEYLQQKEHELLESRNLINQLEKQVVLFTERLAEADRKFTDWKTSNSAAVEQAKSVILEMGGKLSEQLLSHHKREAEEARHKSSLDLTKITQDFHQQFQSVISSVASLNDQVKESKQTVDLVKNALLSPGGAGSLAEITLENILKSSGLKEAIDYVMQYNISDKMLNLKLRPDAVVFLPSDNVMVIDSKSSKFFMELAQGPDNNIEMERKIRDAMRQHLKDLSSKEYGDSLKKSLNNHSSVRFVSTIMFLPSELCLEKLSEIDQEFMEKAWKNNIFPSGPIGLINILSHAKFQITEAKQQENYQHILGEVGNLISSIATLYEHAKKVGSNLQGATEAFDKFAGSFNSNLLSKAKKLNKLGVEAKQNKSLPGYLDRYQMIHANINVIDEAEYSEGERGLVLNNIDKDVESNS